MLRRRRRRWRRLWVMVWHWDVLWALLPFPLRVWLESLRGSNIYDRLNV